MERHTGPGYELRIPQHSMEAESSVLGGLLLASADAWDRVADLLTAGDFYRHDHQLIFAAIGEIAGADRPADVVTVFEHMQRAGQAADPALMAYLNSLAQYVPSAGNIRRYAEIVRERSILRKLAAAGDEISSSAFSADKRPPRELLADAESKIFAIAETEGRDAPSEENMAGLVTRLIDMVQERADNPRDVIGLATGFYDLDRMTTGLMAGDLIILAARPSMGKTAAALNIAEHTAIDQGLPVFVFSLEMGSLQLAIRLVGSSGRIDQQHIRTGRLTDEEWPRLIEAVERLRNVNIHIDETPGITLGEMRSRCRRLKRQYKGCGLIVVDYLQLMGTGGSEENRATALGEITRGLKALAKEIQCPVIALSQLNRSVETRNDKRPQMSDLRESGSLEQDADVIMFIYRDDYYNPDSKEPGVAEVIISKQRNGPTGTVKLAFMKQWTRFESLAPRD